MDYHSVLFRDGTTFTCKQAGPNTLHKNLTSTKLTFFKWFEQNELVLNDEKTVEMNFSLVNSTELT